MNAPRVTVALSDSAAFAARYGLRLARNGKTDAKLLPECEWRAEDGQTAEQARLCSDELKDGTKWQSKQ